MKFFEFLGSVAKVILIIAAVLFLLLLVTAWL